ncbi:MAG: flagellar export protein FliJ [Deltaproteobacteria bacterium]|nr:MAG: flagellar export protein FliJ [Deltaproteobacteria bacterium]
MKKFKFSLESVLKYKIFLEKEAMQEVMSVNFEIRQCEAGIEKITLERENIFNELEKKTSDGISIETFQLFQNYIFSVESRLEKEKDRLSQLFAEKEIKTKKLVEAKKEKEALDSLKEKNRERYIKKMLYEEQKELDEISSTKKAREICDEV